MQSRFTLSFLITIILISFLNPILAQRNPTGKLIDNRLPQRNPGKIESERPKGEKPIRERPIKTKIPEIKSPPPPNDYDPTEQHPRQPPYKPVPPTCYNPPRQPVPHYPNPPENVIINYKLSGKEKLEEGDYEKAIEYLTQAIWLDSNDYELYYFKGITEIKLQFYKEALEDLDYFLEYIIYEPDGYFQRGLAKFYLNKKAEAKEDFLIASEMEHKMAISILKRFY